MLILKMLVGMEYFFLLYGVVIAGCIGEIFVLCCCGYNFFLGKMGWYLDIFLSKIYSSI